MEVKQVGLTTPMARSLPQGSTARQLSAASIGTPGSMPAVRFGGWKDAGSNLVTAAKRAVSHVAKVLRIKADALDPKAALLEEKARYEADFKKGNTELTHIIAQQQLKLVELEEAVKYEQQQELEARAAKAAVDELAEGDEGYEAQLNLLSEEATQWQDAKKARERKELEVQKFTDAADLARAKIQERTEQYQSTLEKIKDAEAQIELTAAQNQLKQVTEQVDSLKLDSNSRLETVRKDILLKYEQSKLDNTGKTAEERLAELKAKNRAKSKQQKNNAVTALEELMASENKAQETLSIEDITGTSSTKKAK